MKIAYFFEIFYPQINGVMTATFNLARNMKKLGHEVLYIAPKTKGYSETHTADGIEVYKLPSIPTYVYDGIRLCHPKSTMIYNKLKKEKVDIVHFTGPFTLSFNALFHGKNLGIPVIQTFHTLLAEATYFQYFFGSKSFPLGEKLVWWGMNIFNRRSDIITAPSEYVISSLKKNCPNKNIIYISNGIDINEFKEFDPFEKLKKNYPEYNNKTFVFVGRLGQEKSVNIIIRAMAEVIKTDREIKLFIIGHGPYAEELQELAKKLDLLNKNIIFTGKIDNKKLIALGLFHHARAFITASKTENQPMTILEATACGTPLILPYEKGIRELIEDNGFFFEADNIKELAEKILLLSSNDTLYKEFKKASLKLSDKYDGINVAKQFEKVYLENIKKLSS